MSKKITQSYNDQLNQKSDLPQVRIEVDPRRIKMFKGNRLLLPGVHEIEAVMRRIPQGKLLTSIELRSYLAHEHNADYTCPVTAAAHIKLVANASVERGHDMVPFWRMLKTDGQLNNNYPGGIEFQRKMLNEEGFEIVQIGTKSVVSNLKDYMFEL